MAIFLLRSTLATAVVAVGLCFACSSSEKEPASDEPETLDGSAEMEAAGGSVFNAELKTDDRDTTVSGQVCNAPPLANRMVVWDLTQKQDGCQLFEPRSPFCDPPCGKDEAGNNTACVEDSVCAAEHTCYDVGTVSVRGLLNAEGKESLSLMNVRNKYSLNANLIYPPFAEGDPIYLEASGAQVTPFSVESRGIQPLEVITGDDLPMERDKPVVLQWTPATIADNSRIEIVVDISHHGGQRGEIVCDVEDSGSFEIPAPLVTALIDLGVAGYPSLDVTRIASGSATIEPGTVYLKILSRQNRLIQIPGVISCPDDDSACPTGQVCESYMCVTP